MCVRQARSKGELPRLYSAVVHADLNLGPIRRLLYWVRPGHPCQLIVWSSYG